MVRFFSWVCQSWFRFVDVLVHCARRSVALVYEHKIESVFFLFVAALIWFQWFLPGHIIAGGDYLSPLKPWGLMEKVLSAWLPDYLGTEVFMEANKVIPYYIFWGFFDVFGASPFLIEKLWFIFLNLLGGIGLLYFFRQFLPDLKSVPAQLTAVSFYLFNLAVVTEFNHDTALFAYYSLPLIAGTFVFALKKRNLRSLAQFVLSSTFLFAVASNPALFLVVLGVLFSLLIIELFEAEPKEKIPMLSFLLPLGLTFLLMNAFWIFTTLAPLFVEHAVSPFSQSHLSWDWVVEKSGRASFFNLFRELGKFSWFSAFSQEPTFSYAPIYKSAILVLSSVFVPLVAFLSLLLARKKPYYRRVLWMALFLLLVFFIAKGGHEPFPDFFHWLYNSLPGFKVFREPYTKLIVAFPFYYACLLAAAGASLFSFSRRRVWLPLFLLVVVNAGILLNAWPLLFGEQTLKNRVAISDYLTEYPAYWSEAADYLNAQKDDVSQLYVSPPGTYLYTWGYGGHPFERRLFFMPRIQARGIFGSFVKDLLLSRFERSFVEGNTTAFSSLGTLLRIDTLLHRNDVDWFWNSRYYSKNYDLDANRPPSSYEDFLNRKSDFQFEKYFGDLALFRHSQAPYPLVTIPRKVTYFTTRNVRSGVAYYEMSGLSPDELPLFDHDLDHLSSQHRQEILQLATTVVASPDSSSVKMKDAQFEVLSSPLILRVPEDLNYRVLLSSKGTLSNLLGEQVQLMFKPRSHSKELDSAVTGDEALQQEAVFDIPSSEVHPHHVLVDVGEVFLKQGTYELQILAGEAFVSPLFYDDLFLVGTPDREPLSLPSAQIDQKSATSINLSLSEPGSSPFLLTFYQSYRPHWNLNGLNSTAPHFRSHFYANTWLIDPDELGGQSLDIVYSLQKYFFFLLLVTTSLIVVSGFYVLFTQQDLPRH